VPRPIHVEGADHVLELLVRDHPAHEHHIGPVVVEPAGECAIGNDVEVGEVGNDRQHSGVRKPERLELEPVVLGVAEGQLTAIDVGSELAAAAEAQLDEILVNSDEVLGGRDVVVDERHSPGQRVRGPRRPRSDREMVDQDVVWRDPADHIAVVERQVLESGIRGLHEDGRVVSGCRKRALNPEYFVTDRVAIAERGEHLMNARTRPGGSGHRATAA